MSATLTETTSSGADRLFEPDGERSLDDVLARVAHALELRGNARCLVCGATLVRGAGNEPAACGGCGASFE